jgi:urease accessory protein
MESRLWVAFEDTARGTIMRLREQQPPWKVVRSFRNESGEALVHLQNISGGILDRDHLSLRIDVQSGAEAQVTSTSATRIYRSRGPEHCATQRIEVSVENAGLLEYIPDPLIPFARSRFTQHTQIHLEAGATLFWWEINAPGREASGETFAFDLLSSSLEIYVDDLPISIERWSLEPRLRSVESLGRLGPFRYWTTFYICHPAAASLRLDACARELSRPSEVSWGVSALPDYGVVIRGVSRRGRDLLHGLVCFWKCAKASLLDRPALPPRKIW